MMAEPQTFEDLKNLGQLFMVGLPGLTLDDSTLMLIRRYRVNNFIYFKRNAADPHQLQQLSKDLRSACRDRGLAPPLVAIDQEGGTVARLPEPFTQFPDARVLAESEEPENALVEYAHICARELKSIGVNYNLAPVLDVCEAGRKLFMEKRALGNDPALVGRLGSLVIRTMQADGLAACAKHFPGLGAAVVDPHLTLPVVAKEEREIRARDLVPFKQAVAVGVASIMTSHTVYHALDPGRPATLSRKILTGMLRKELGFDGVIITDDLEMGAIEKERHLDQAPLQAFMAGADMLLICHTHEKVVGALAETTEAVAKNPELQERARQSLQRVSLMRQKFARQ